MKFLLSKKMQLIGSPMPRFYRDCWYDINRACLVCYPLGIHWIAIWIHRMWEKTYYRDMSKWELDLATSYQKGYDEGKKSMEKRVHKNVDELVTFLGRKSKDERESI